MFLYNINFIMEDEFLDSEHKVIEKLFFHHKNTFIHSLKVAFVSYVLSSLYFKDDKKAILTAKCGLFHDIGKLGMSEDFLDFSTYTPEMRLQMEKHSYGGALVLEKIGSPTPLVETAKVHHSLESANLFLDHIEMVHLADCFTAAIAQDRSYKEPISPLCALYDILSYEEKRVQNKNILDIFSSFQFFIIEKNTSEYEYYSKLFSIYNLEEQLKTDSLFSLCFSLAENSKGIFY